MEKFWKKFQELISIKNKVFMFLFIIGLWGTLAHFNDPIILPGPKLVFNSLVDILKEKSSYLMIFHSIKRVTIGLLIAFSLGVPLGIFVAGSEGLKSFIMPLVKFLQGTPVISWILLALIWFKLDSIPIFILVLNSLPILVISVYEGVIGIDKKLLEMSKFYQVKKSSIIKKLYIPSIVSHIIASTSIILSSSFKIVIMAEIITKISTGIGSNINYAWINIETEKILAWTIIAVFLSIAIDKFINKILKKRLGRYYA